jgi:hypothetical protein
MNSFAQALDRRRPLSAIRPMVESGLQDDPEFLVRRDRYGGMIPLHYAVSGQSDVDYLDVVEYLVLTCPESVKIRMRDGMHLALHLAHTRRWRTWASFGCSSGSGRHR